MNTELNKNEQFTIDGYSISIVDLFNTLSAAIANKDVVYVHNVNAFAWRMPNTKVWHHCDTLVECFFQMHFGGYPIDIVHFFEHLVNELSEREFKALYTNDFPIDKQK